MKMCRWRFISLTNGEVHRLLAAISALPAAPTSPFRRENLRLAVVLLYTTGLRLGELIRLTLGDYDPREHTLLIRDSKFHKSRLVPLSIDGTREIDEYLGARRSHRMAISPESPLLWHHTRRGTAYTGTGLTNAIRPLLRALQIRTETGRLPRVHDFRHTFALEALLRWCRGGSRLSRFGIRYILRKHCARAQQARPALAGERLHPHSMRHSTAVHLLRAGVDILTISQWLGHASVTTTNRYATTDLEMKRKAIEQAQAIDHKTDDSASLWRTDASVLAWLEAL